MIILLNGPLGIGKTTLAEVLMENIDKCVMLDGDFLAAVNPEPLDGLEHLHSTLALLVPHYKSLGYEHFVISHIWTKQEEIDDLRYRMLDHDTEFYCFLLTLSAEENYKRINLRASARIVDEQEFELRTVVQEREMLKSRSGSNLGEPLDVSAPPIVLVKEITNRLGIPSASSL